MKLTNLENVIKELNSSTSYEFEGKIETLESPYHFVYEIENKRIKIYDRNENFNIDCDEEHNAMVYECAEEFGFEYETPKSIIEEITKKLEIALKKDLHYSVYLEWNDSVVMYVCK